MRVHFLHKNLLSPLNQSEFPFHVADVDHVGLGLRVVALGFEIEPVLVAVCVCVDPEVEIEFILGDSRCNL